MNQPVIVDYIRTPIGGYNGALKDVRPDDLAALTIQGIVERNQVAPVEIDDVILGCTNQAGEDSRNVGRLAALLAGLPVAVPGQTINRLCASGMQAVISAAQAIRSDEGLLFIAGGVESMTRSPFVMLKPEKGFPRGNFDLVDTTLGWRFTNPRLAAVYYPYSLGETAENVAERFQIGREEQDAFAAETQKRVGEAIEAGWYDDELLPVTVEHGSDQPKVVDKDEHPRPGITTDRLAQLPPVFRFEGTVTAGNSSGVNDGAAALLVTSEESAHRHGWTPMTRIVGSAVAGVDPAFMGIGPVPATRKLLERTGVSLEEIDLIEINEAFAVQVVACMRELGLDPTKVNRKGGAIALGHPLGASGARILGSASRQLVETGGRYALVTLCIGVGQGMSVLLERAN